MFTRKAQHSLVKLSFVFGIATLLALGAAWQIRQARAASPPDPNRFGMIGITHGETLRLNVVNLTSPPEPERQIPPPCRVVLTFRDASGRPFRNSDGQIVRREVSLQGGESAFLDLNADQFGPPSTNDAVTPLRLQLRPLVRVLTTPPDPDLPPPCFPTMEVIDNASGRTSIFATGHPRLIHNNDL